MTKIASGYWHVADSQTGYTVANLKALSTIDLDSSIRATASRTTCSCT